MKCVPRHIKKGDLIEVTGIDWETVVEWVELDQIEKGVSQGSMMRIPGYYIHTEPDGTVVWAGMLDKSRVKCNTKYVHYMNIAAINSIKLLRKGKGWLDA